MLGGSRTNPIRMEEQMMENSASEIYLGDKINEKGTAASITEIIEIKLPASVAKVKEIMNIFGDPQLIGVQPAIGPINDYETKIIPKFLNNAWLILNDSHLKRLQNFQDNFIRKVFQVSDRGTQCYGLIARCSL